MIVNDQTCNVIIYILIEAIKCYQITKRYLPYQILMDYKYHTFGS